MKNRRLIPFERHRSNNQGGSDGRHQATDYTTRPPNCEGTQPSARLQRLRRDGGVDTDTQRDHPCSEERKGIEHIKQFFRKKKIDPFTRKKIREKNAYFDLHYEAVIIVGHNGRDSASDATSRINVLIYNKYNGANEEDDSDPNDRDPSYENAIDLKSHDIKGFDNESYLDTLAQNCMHLSDIKYQTLRKALEWLEKTKKPEFKQYRLSIDNFQPHILTGHDIKDAYTKRTVSQVIEKYKRRKQEANQPLTEEENNGTFFFPLGSDEFNQITLGTTSGKEKLFFLGNYFPGLYPTGVRLKIRQSDFPSFAHSRKFSMLTVNMEFPLERIESLRGSRDSSLSSSDSRPSLSSDSLSSLSSDSLSSLSSDSLSSLSSDSLSSLSSDSLSSLSSDSLSSLSSDSLSSLPPRYSRPTRDSSRPTRDSSEAVSGKDKQKSHSTPYSQLQQALYNLEIKAFASQRKTNQLPNTTEVIEGTMGYEKKEASSLRIHETDNNTKNFLQRIEKIQEQLMGDIQRLQTLQSPIEPQESLVAWKSESDIHQRYGISSSMPLLEHLAAIKDKIKNLERRQATEKQLQTTPQQKSEVSRQKKDALTHQKKLDAIIEAYNKKTKELEERIHEFYMMRLKVKELMNSLQYIKQEQTKQRPSNSQAANLDGRINDLMTKASEHEKNRVEQRDRALRSLRGRYQEYDDSDWFFLPSQRYKYTPLQGYEAFAQNDSATCGPTTTRRILADKNPHFRSVETEKEVVNAFPVVYDNGATDTSAIPDILKSLGHPIPYQYIPYDSSLTMDKILDMISEDNKDIAPLILNLYNPYNSEDITHIVSIDGIMEKTFKYNGIQYKDRGVGIRDPEEGGISYWVCLDDFQDCWYGAVCRPDL